MEDIIARTPEQEKKLKKLKEQLDQLEKEKQQQTPNKTNWIPWLIGGGITLILVVGIIAFLWGKQNSKRVKSPHHSI